MSVTVYQPITFGDTSGDLEDHIVAGDQSLDNGSTFLIDSTIVGDASTLSQFAHGGNDTIEMFGIGDFLAIGDAFTITNHATGGNDDVTTASRSTSTAIGDALTLNDHTHGGNDSVSALGLDAASAFGDAQTITDRAHGGNDTVSATSVFQDAVAYGDSETMFGHAQGGDDTVTATNNFNTLTPGIMPPGLSASAYGDAQVMSGFAHGGNDHVDAEAAIAGALAYGDAQTMTDHARGGDDVVTGNGPAPQLYGDAYTLTGFAVGGNDTLIAPNNPNAMTQMYGDGAQLLDHAKGGNDTLISGPGNDQMWGDAAIVAPTAHTGADMFVFSLALIDQPSPSIGHDTIMDFQPGQDQIQIQGFENITNFADVQSHTTDTAQGSLITIDATDSILVGNDHNLTSGDFMFT